MKKILIAAVVACALVSSALAQGLVTFSATGSSTTTWVPGMIAYTVDGKAPMNLVAKGTPAQVPGYGNLNVAMYSAPKGTGLSLVGGLPDLTGLWKMQTSAINNALAAAGYMTAKVVTMDASTYNAAGEMQLEVVAWTGTYNSFGTAAAAAMAGQPVLFAWSGDALSGGALSWVSGSGSSTSPYVITKGANAFNGLVLAPIPEPSTFALAGLGAAALLIFRRRK
jgi:hypothetical protein